MEQDNLEPLVTECPHCQTRFRVTDHQLQLAAGRVRCGACLTVFQGVEHLVWEEPPEFRSPEEAQSALDALLDELGGDSDAAATPDQVASHDDPLAGQDPGDAAAGVAGDEPQAAGAWLLGDQKLYGGHEDPAGITLAEHPWPDAPPRADAGGNIADSAAALAPGGDAADAGVTPAGAAEAADFAFGEPAKRRWWVPVAMAVAVVTLFLQVLWYQFDRWSVDPATRPLYAAFCQVLECELPVMRSVEAMVAKNLVVRSHPTVADALVVNAVIVNEAAFAQPFPRLELKFTELNGALVAGRQFKPEEYLAGELLGAQMLASNVPVHVELAIEDPGQAAVNYYLTFR